MNPIPSGAEFSCKHLEILLPFLPETKWATLSRISKAFNSALKLLAFEDHYLQQVEKRELLYATDTLTTGIKTAVLNGQIPIIAKLINSLFKVVEDCPTKQTGIYYRLFTSLCRLEKTNNENLDTKQLLTAKIKKFINEKTHFISLLLGYTINYSQWKDFVHSAIDSLAKEISGPLCGIGFHFPPEKTELLGYEGHTSESLFYHFTCLMKLIGLGYPKIEAYFTKESNENMDYYPQLEYIARECGVVLTCKKMQKGTTVDVPMHVVASPTVFFCNQSHKWYYTTQEIDFAVGSRYAVIGFQVFKHGKTPIWLEKMIHSIDCIKTNGHFSFAFVAYNAWFPNFFAYFSNNWLASLIESLQRKDIKCLNLAFYIGDYKSVEKKDKTRRKIFKFISGLMHHPVIKIRLFASLNELQKSKTHQDVIVQQDACWSKFKSHLQRMQANHGEAIQYNIYESSSTNVAWKWTPTFQEFFSDHTDEDLKAFMG